ncbi:MAG: O-antigen ligase family protein [Candidatus Woesebacteria bacterium]|nr:MAG: O-antigen ligase family protein [Candidatus Woesebacteria bacterium]
MSKLLSRFNTISKYLIAAVLIIVPLFPKFPLVNVSGTYVAVRFEDLLLFTLAVFTLIKIVPNFKSFFSDKIVQAFLIFFGVGLLSVFSGVYLTQTVGLSLGLLHWARRIEYAVPFLATITLLARDKVSENLDFYIKVLLIVVVAVFIYGIGEMYFRFPVIITQNMEYSKGVALFWIPGSHINSTFAGHYDLAAFIVLVIPIFIAFIFLLKDNFSKILFSLVSGAGLWLLINSLSRTGQISYLAAVTFALMMLKKFKGLAVVLVVSVFLILMSSGVNQRFRQLIKVFGMTNPSITVYADETTLPTKRVDLSTPTPAPVPVVEDRSTSIRLYVEWPRAIRGFKINPVLGTGYSSIDLATDNDYLRSLGETGLFGFLAFWLIFFRIGNTFVGSIPVIRKLDPLSLGFMVGLFGGIFGTFLSALFIDLFEASKFATIFWLLLGLAVYVVKNKQYEQE